MIEALTTGLFWIVLFAGSIALGWHIGGHVDQ